MRDVTVAHSPATASVKSVIGKKVVTTRSPLPADELSSLGLVPPQATSPHIKEIAPTRESQETDDLLSKSGKAEKGNDDPEQGPSSNDNDNHYRLVAHPFGTAKKGLNHTMVGTAMLLTRAATRN